jgi:hypothetical protein
MLGSGAPQQEVTELLDDPAGPFVRGDLEIQVAGRHTVPTLACRT